MHARCTLQTLQSCTDTAAEAAGVQLCMGLGGSSDCEQHLQ